MGVIKGQIKKMVRGSVEDTLNKLLDAEVERRMQHITSLQMLHGDHYDCNPNTNFVDVVACT